MNTRAKKIYFGNLVTLVAIIAVLNYLAFQFYWYWRFWWFDMIMHTLGGLWVGSAVLWYRFLSRNDSFSPDGKILAPEISFVFAFSLASIAIIGVGWELFEFSVDTFITLSLHDPVDTASDLFFDTLGSIIAVFLFFQTYDATRK